MIDPEFHDDLLAELAVLNAAAMTALREVARSKEDPAAYIRDVHESGLGKLRAANYWSVPADRLEAFHAKIEARWADLITSLRV